jgi:hypothetical protein
VICSPKILAPVLGSVFALTAALVANPVPAQADWGLLPKNSHQLYETYGLFIDNQTTMVYYGASRAYGGIGGSFALFGNPDTLAHPQIVVIASVNAAMIFAESGRIYSDEIDVRAGGAFEFALDPAIRLSIGAIHHSGHVADGAVDVELLGTNLGANYFFIRGLYDLGPYARVGLTFQPVLHAGPSLNTFAANEFAEFFPLGGMDDRKIPSPYIAIGLEQGGTDAFGAVNILNLQIGAYLGNHFSNDHVPTARVVLGYYTGADPRLKYFQFRDSRLSFGYAGMMFDI